MPSYKTSNGDRIEKSVIDHRIRQAKERKKEEFLKEHGYIFCEEVGCRTPNVGPFDRSHDMSVKECQEIGSAELAWDVDNIKYRCRKCHNIHDKTY